jgi:hypothetical protein
MSVPILPHKENDKFFCTDDALLLGCLSSQLKREQCLFETVVTIVSYFHRYNTEIYLYLGCDSLLPTHAPETSFSS